jgi:hypothetical protein
VAKRENFKADNEIGAMVEWVELSVSSLKFTKTQRSDGLISRALFVCFR